MTQTNLSGYVYLFPICLFKRNTDMLFQKRQRRPVPPMPQSLYCRACGETNTCEWRRGPGKSFIN